jgi:hypothetical protein
VIRNGKFVAHFFLLFLCYLNPVSFAQTVVIRVVNVHGKPISNKQVSVSWLSTLDDSIRHEQIELIRRPIRADVSLVTDSKGETAFDLPNPAPAYVYVRPAFKDRVWDCTCSPIITTDELLRKGYLVISPYASREKPMPSIQPRAGEVLFVMKRLPLWVQILWPIEKG